MGLKNYLNLKNITAIATSPFTAGASLALLNDGNGNDILGELTGSNSAKQANKQNIELQRETNETSINLANTAHQREVADLKEAGLNPVLSAGGTGAATPTLGTAQVEQTQPGGKLAQAAKVAQIANLAGTAKQATAQAELNKINTKLAPDLTQSEIGKNQAEAYKTLIDAGYSEKQIANATKEYELIEQQIKTANSAEELNKAETKIKEWEGRHPVLSRMMGMFGGMAGGLVGGSVGRSLLTKTPNKIGF